jgi:hypothetical protein
MMRLKLAPMGLDPGLDPRVYQKISFRWIAGSSPAMTAGTEQ